MTASLVRPLVAHPHTVVSVPPFHPSLDGRVYGMRCNCPMPLTEQPDGSWWYVCLPPCGQHRVPAVDLEREVRTEVLRRWPELYDPADPAGSVTAAVESEVAQVRIVGTDFVVIPSPRQGGETS